MAKRAQNGTQKGLKLPKKNVQIGQKAWNDQSGPNDSRDKNKFKMIQIGLSLKLLEIPKMTKDNMRARLVKVAEMA